MPLYSDIYRQTVLKDSPILYYRLNESDKSNKITDEMGNFNLGIYNNITKSGNSLLLNNPNQISADLTSNVENIDTVDVVLPIDNSDFSIELWISLSEKNKIQTIFSLSSGGAGVFRLDIQLSNILIFKKPTATFIIRALTPEIDTNTS